MALAICCMIFCSFKSVLAKRLLHIYEPSTFSLFDQLSTMLFVLPFLHVRNLAALDADFWLMLGCIVFPSVLGLVYLSKATKHGQISDVSPLLIFLPVFIALSGPFWQEEKLSSAAWVGIWTVGFGGYCLKLESFKRPWEPFLRFFTDRAARYLWISVVLGVWSTQIQKWMVQAYDTGTVLFFSTLGVLLCLAPLSYRHAGGLRNLSREASQTWKWLLILGLVSAISGWSQLAAYNEGGEIATVLSIKRLSVIFVCFYGFAVLRESMNVGKVFGIGLMTLGGIMLFYT